MILEWSWRVFLCVVFQVHLWPTLLSASAYGRGYCAWWVSYFIMSKWEWRRELLCFSLCFSSCEMFVCRSVSAGFSRVTCSRAAAAASYGGVGSGSRTSAGASAGLRNPGHTFRIADPQKRGRGLCCPTRSTGVTATSRLTLVTKLSRDANETCWTLVEAWWKRKETNTRGSCEKDVSQCCWIITVSVSSVSAEVCRNWNCVWYILIRKSSNLCVLFVLSFCNNQMPYYEIHLQYIYNCCFFVFLDQYHWNNQKSCQIVCQ